MSGSVPTPDRNKALLVFVLSIVLGWLGADRFVNGNIVLGLLKLFTVGGLGFWWLIDAIIFGARYLSVRQAWARRQYAASVATQQLAPSATARREHQAPAPQGAPVAPWTAVSRTTEVAGEFYRQPTYDALFAGLARDGSWHNLDVDADLYPDPYNPHSENGNAVSVWVRGLQAGFLESPNSGRYSPALRDLAENHGQYLRVPARASGTYDPRRRQWHAIVRLGLPEPEDLMPRNQLPAGSIEILPSGRIVQVTGEKDHMDVLSQLVEPGRAVPYAATLRTVHEIRPRSAVETVEVQIDGERVGVLSKAMAEQVGPLVQLVERAGRVPVVRATVEGNELSAEVKLRVIRAAEADADWIRELRAIPPAPRTSTNPRGEEFEWDDDDPSEVQR